MAKYVKKNAAKFASTRKRSSAPNHAWRQYKQPASGGQSLKNVDDHGRVNCDDHQAHERGSQ